MINFLHERFSSRSSFNTLKLFFLPFTILIKMKVSTKQLENPDVRVLREFIESKIKFIKQEYSENQLSTLQSPN